MWENDPAGAMSRVLVDNVDILNERGKAPGAPKSRSPPPAVIPLSVTTNRSPRLPGSFGALHMDLIFGRTLPGTGAAATSDPHARTVPHAPPDPGTSTTPRPGSDRHGPPPARSLLACESCPT
eukprot:4544184-Prymnesium_polylepis.1